MDDRVNTLLERAGVLAELGPAHLFWSADKAIASLGVSLDDGMQTAVSRPAITEGILHAPFAEQMPHRTDAGTPMNDEVMLLPLRLDR